MTPRLDSRALALFLAVADTLSFRQAAEALHLSQPPLSRAIRGLEERLGTRLFDRNTQGVALTAAGRLLVPKARRILVLLQEAEAALMGAGASTTLRLGLTSAVEADWFAHLLDGLRTARPDRAITPLTDTSPRLVRLLLKHRLDAALIALPTDTRDLTVTWLDRQPLVVALPAAHPLARRRALSLSQLNGQRLFWFERARQPAFFDHCQAVFARHAFSPVAVLEPKDHPVLLAGVARGEALALLPSSFQALQRDGVRYRPLAEGDELAVGIGLATPGHLGDLHAELARAARAVTG
ncbi:LysR family transcriptional regulator [Rhizobacter sp. Root1221]|uniref:LysR family transcriptional regulator n=1 Tax=Rhizobacter sp. Root1221 TaxID=1736433 RepID=UPI0006F4E3A0|nr:LysR family transcriptional regulator [Rhizobacter sp. Root1221]KQV81261.1 LysR family transcriptional regulator [Rhizobacter sp. Root1221]